MALGVLSHSFLQCLLKRWHDKLNAVKLLGSETQFVALSHMIGKKFKPIKSNTARKQPGCS